MVRIKYLFIVFMAFLFLAPTGGFGLDEAKVPTQDEITGWVDTICIPENRRPGEAGDLKAEDYIYQKFTEFGLKDVKKEPVDLTLWRAESWSLAAGDQEVPSFYVLNSGFTPQEGVTGEMVYLGNGTVEDFKATDVKGKIAVIDLDFGILPVLPLILLASYYVYDPDRTFLWWDWQPATWVRENWDAEPEVKGAENIKNAYAHAIKNGAVGVVWILKEQPTNINSYYAPYEAVMTELPALYVGKYDGEKLKERLQTETLKGKMVLRGTKTPGVMHNICGVLPGKSRESFLITTHHDAPFKGYTEDGTGLGTVLSLAKYFSRIPEGEREKTLIFVASAGHFYGSRGMETWVTTHKEDYVKDIVLNLNMEHIAAKEFVENSEGDFEDTGRMQTRGLFIFNNNHYKQAIREALNDNRLARTVVVAITALGEDPPGEGIYTNRAGIPIIHYISGPTYLLVDADTRDKVNFDELVPAAKTFIEIIEKLAPLSRDELTKKEKEE
jgi:hypothetical protein